MRNSTTFADPFVKSLLTEGSILDDGLVHVNKRGQIIRLFTMMSVDGCKYAVLTVGDEVRVITTCVVR